MCSFSCSRVSNRFAYETTGSFGSGSSSSTLTTGDWKLGYTSVWTKVESEETRTSPERPRTT